MLRLGRIRAYRAVNAPWPSAPIAEKPSVKNARWNAVGIPTAVTATTITKHIPAFGNPFRVSAGLRSEVRRKKRKEVFAALRCEQGPLTSLKQGRGAGWRKKIWRHLSPLPGAQMPVVTAGIGGLTIPK
jgi:hypothetical protein